MLSWQLHYSLFRANKMLMILWSLISEYHVELYMFIAILLCSQLAETVDSVYPKLCLICNLQTVCIMKSRCPSGIPLLKGIKSRGIK